MNVPLCVFTIFHINFNQHPNENVVVRACWDLNEFQNCNVDDMLIYQNKLSISHCERAKERKNERSREIRKRKTLAKKRQQQWYGNDAINDFYELKTKLSVAGSSKYK